MPANARRPLGRGDGGSTSVEMAGYAAVMLAALLVGTQAAVWGLAEIACRHAASHALQVTRVAGGSAAAGEADAATVLGQVGPNLVTDPRIQASRGPATASVTVTGTAPAVVPFLALPVGAALSAPVETLPAQAAQP
jgi:hypothetical protein